MYAAGSERELFRAFNSSCRVARPPGVLSPASIVVAAQRLDHFRGATPASCCFLPLQPPLYTPRTDAQPADGTFTDASNEAQTALPGEETGFVVSWRSRQYTSGAVATTSSLVPRIAAVLLLQLSHCSVVQAAKSLAALTSTAAAATQLPVNFAHNFANGIAMDSHAASEADTEVSNSPSVCTASQAKTVSMAR